MNNEPVAWMYKDEESGMVSFIKDTLPFDAVPLYTHQYERPNNTVLVPCDKLAEMQAEIEALKEVNTWQVDCISKQKEEYEKLWKEHMELFWKHEKDVEEEQEK